MNYTVDQQRLQISELHFDIFPTPSTVSCWKITFKTEVRSCSGSPILRCWKDRVCSEQNYPEFLLQHKRSIWRNRNLKKVIDRQIAHIIYDHFHVTGARDTVIGCADLFTITLSH